MEYSKPCASLLMGDGGKVGVMMAAQEREVVRRELGTDELALKGGPLKTCNT